MISRFLLSLAILLIFIAPASGESQEMQETKQAEIQLKGKVVTFRHISSGDSLVFDDQFKLVKGGKPGRWTLDGLLEIRKVSLKGKNYVLEGNRIHLIYEPGRKQLARYRSPQKIKMELPTTSSDGRPVNLRQFLIKSFLRSDELYPEDLPAYWKPFLTCVRENHPNCDDPRKDIDNPDYPPRSDPKGNMTYPRILVRVEPHYTEIAKNTGLKGTVIFLASIDKEGQLQILEIVRPLGLGLDESAAEALSQWKFSPAIRNSQPAAVRMTVEVNFDLR